MPDVRVPTLILHGRGDTVVDIATSRQFAAGKRHVRLVELDDGHELTASIPRLLDEAQHFLANFLVPAGSEAA
jgi:alpha-beta hydrolase superfamily lysophospholipase